MLHHIIKKEYLLFWNIKDKLKHIENTKTWNWKLKTVHIGQLKMWIGSRIKYMNQIASILILLTLTNLKRAISPYLSWLWVQNSFPPSHSYFGAPSWLVFFFFQSLTIWRKFYLRCVTLNVSMYLSPNHNFNWFHTFWECNIFCETQPMLVFASLS